jgi:hypothetical protein
MENLSPIRLWRDGERVKCRSDMVSLSHSGSFMVLVASSEVLIVLLLSF